MNGEDLRKRREVCVGLSIVHVLRAVENDDVVVTDDLQSDKYALFSFGEVAEDELDVNLGDGGVLDAVDEAEEVAVEVVVCAGEDSNKEGEFWCGVAWGYDDGFVGLERSFCCIEVGEIEEEEEEESEDG